MTRVKIYCPKCREHCMADRSVSQRRVADDGSVSGGNTITRCVWCGSQFKTLKENEAA